MEQKGVLCETIDLKEDACGPRRPLESSFLATGLKGVKARLLGEVYQRRT